MQRRRYSPDVKARAIELATTIGVPEAEAQTGVPRGTIGSWLTRAGLTNATDDAAANARRQAIAVARETWTQRRAELGNRMGEVAAETLEALSVKVAASRSREARELAGALAVLVDKAQLLAGDATARVEQVGTTAAPTERRERSRGVVVELASRQAS